MVLLATGLAGCGRDSLPAFPGIVLWAWESPQRLDFLNPEDAGVVHAVHRKYPNSEWARKTRFWYGSKGTPLP